MEIIIFNDIGLKQQAIQILEDNQAAIAIMTRPEKESKMRHLDPKYFRIHELIQATVIFLKYVTSAENNADLMTKVLPKAVHLGVIKSLGLWNSNLLENVNLPFPYT